MGMVDMEDMATVMEVMVMAMEVTVMEVMAMDMVAMGMEGTAMDTVAMGMGDTAMDMVMEDTVTEVMVTAMVTAMEDMVTTETGNLFYIVDALLIELLFIILCIQK